MFSRRDEVLVDFSDSMIGPDKEIHAVVMEETQHEEWFRVTLSETINGVEEITVRESILKPTYCTVCGEPKSFYHDKKEKFFCPFCHEG